MMKVRKSVVERKLENHETQDQSNFFMTELKGELFELDLTKMQACVLPELQNNLQKFRTFMDKIDSYNFNLNLVKNIEFDPVEELEIEEIKKVSKMKEILRNYKFVLEKQNNIIKILSSYKNVTYDPEKISQKISLLTLQGLEQQKKYLEEQENRINESNLRFQAAESCLNDTFNKL